MASGKNSNISSNNAKEIREEFCIPSKQMTFNASYYESQENGHIQWVTHAYFSQLTNRILAKSFALVEFGLYNG